MNFQLVLQFCGESLADYNKLIGLENILIDELKGAAKFDGHDFGSGEMNIFIHTDKPSEVFEMTKPVLAKEHMLSHLVAAFRERTGEDYTLLWPAGYPKPFKIT